MGLMFTTVVVFLNFLTPVVVGACDTLTVKYLRNYDGDTITVDIPNTHPLFGKAISVRIRGIDTPEKNGKHPCEKEKAKAAQQMVEKLLTGAEIELKDLGRDKYFRILATVYADGKSVGGLLINKRLAYPYDGGKKKEVDWCR